MKISEILTEELISVGMEPKDKDDAIRMMIDIAARSGKILDKEKVCECVFEREKLVSTGVGKGFAIPHGKTDEISDVTAAFGIVKTPIDFDSIDSEPVKFIFLLIGKDSLLNTHIKLLSRISRLMNNDKFRDKLDDAKTSAEVLELFRKEEENYQDI
jgi:fructose-specific phosphotransferase system IIA component